MTALYKIAGEYAALMDEDLPLDVIADTLEGIEAEFEAKAEQLLAVIKCQNALADALKSEASALNERAKAANNKVDSLKAYLAECMEKTGRKSIMAGVHSLTVRAPSKSVDVTDESALPLDFVTYDTVTKVDKKAIMDALKAGAEVPGAQIKIGKPSLLIK